MADEAKMIIKRFGRGKTQMSYSEFTRLFTGAKQPYFSIMNTTSAKRFSVDTSDLIQQLFELHIQSEAILEKFRQRVFSRSDFDLDAAFEYFDTDNDGHISATDLNKVFSQNSIRMSKVDIRRIIKRFDLNMDGKISYKEFT